MSRYNDLQMPARGQKTLPDEPPVRKVTIQQKVVQAPSTSVAAPNNTDSFRRYPKVAPHDPSGRGHRGKHWAKPGRGVVANIVKDLNRGVVPTNVNNREYGQRKMSDDSVGMNFPYSSKLQNLEENRDSNMRCKSEERVVETSPRSGSAFTVVKAANVEQVSGRKETKSENNTGKPAGQTILPKPIVPPKPKRKTPETNVQTSLSKAPEKTTKAKKENKAIVPKGKPIISLTKTLEIKQQANAQQVEFPSEKASEARTTIDAKKPALERKISDSTPTEEDRGRWESALQELKEKISDRKMQKPDVRKHGFKNEDRMSAKTQQEPSTSLRDELNAEEAESRTQNLLENSSKSDMTTTTVDFRYEENKSDKVDPKMSKVKQRDVNSPSWLEERKLWEKAVKEMESIISDKDLVIDNLSRVNRKLSEDIEYYEDTLRDLKERDGINNDNRNSDIEQYQRIIEERDERIQALEVRIIGDREGYQKIIDQRETQIMELESKVHELHQFQEAKGRNLLELSHGSQNVLKTLELKRDKVELEKRVEELQERLKFCESASQNQTRSQDTNSDGRVFQEIPSLLHRFREGIEIKLQENAKVVSVLEEKLIKCVKNCEKLTKLSKNSAKHVFEDEIVKESCQQVQSSPDLEETSFRDSIRGHLPPGDLTQQTSSPGNLTQQNISLPDFSESSTPPEVTRYVENIRNLEEELQKEKLINEDLMEKFIRLEELNTQCQDSISLLESKAKDAEGLRVENQKLRAQNEDLVNEISEMKEKNSEGTNDDDNLESHGKQASSPSDWELQEREITELREKLVEEEALIKELREKVAEDEELIEELRANCQREEKWNREMQRNYEWELSTSAKKDDCIEEFQDCLWAREKLVQELQQQLDFEDKRCEELLEKLIVTQKEAEEFQEMSKDMRKKLEDSENRIKEFCDQNDRDAVTIGNLTSENKQLQLEVDGLVKMKRNLEEDLERANGCLEAVEADKENFLTRQECTVNKLSVELEDKEYRNQGKDEVIEKLQENVVQLSADVQEMEFKMEEGRVSLEEDVKKAREDVVERDKKLDEALEKYKELQEVCKCLRETISEKEGDVLEREAAMALQRETIEGLEKDVENLRLICGDNSAPLNDKPELVYTEAEMEEVSDFLEEERTLTEILRKQISFLESEIEELKRNFQASAKALVEKDQLITVAQNQIKKHEILTEETKEELNNVNAELLNTKEELRLANGELWMTKDELKSAERELDENKTSTTLLQVEMTELNTKYNLLEAVKENVENELLITKENLEKLHTETETFKELNKQLLSENEELKQTCLTKERGIDYPVTRLLATELQSEELVLQAEPIVTNLHQQKIKEVTDGQERLVLQNELNELKQEFKEILDENNELKVSLNEVQALNEAAGLKNHALQRKVEKLTDKWLKSEEKIRQAQITNVNLRYTLDEYISQSQDQIRHLKNHEREVATLTKHIHEMDVLVQGFKTALTQAVENEKNEEKCVKKDQNEESQSQVKETGIRKEPCGKPEKPEKPPRRFPRNDQNVQNKTHFKESELKETQSDVTPVTENGAITDSNLNDVSKGSQSLLEIMKTFHEKILAVNIPKNVILILIFAILVFSLGCTNNAIISRKYLFVLANSLITLIFFALWVNELHKNKKYKAVDLIFGENFEFQEVRKDGCQLPQVTFYCENCGNKTDIQHEKLQRYAKIKSSFQDLHEKFLEAVENSSKDTLPIQELYEKYEKLKDEVEVMRKERLEKDMMNAVVETDIVPASDGILPEKWNKAAIILGKAVVITLLCEVLYIRGIFFLPDAVNVVSFLLSLITISYFYETIYVEAMTREEPCTTTREMELEQEIDELNHIIDKEHELVTTQREAIKALEKRLRKEFEKRIKQRNVLLKKLKYKGKLEDLRELLGNEDESEHKRNIDMNSNNNRNGESEKKAVNGNTGDNNARQMIASGHNNDQMSTSWDNEEYPEINKSNEEHERINHDVTEKLQEILSSNEKVSDKFEFIFSPMFFVLGLPLTGILLLCRYITVPVLMMVIQGALILKETKFIKVPKLLLKNINPIIMDSVVVLYACILALFLQCTQSIVVLVTCAIAELAVHWWTSYRLAKKEDVLQEISLNCLSNST